MGIVYHLLHCICLVALLSLVVDARNDDICRLFSNGTVIRDPDSCSRYITCIDFISHYGTCTGSTPFFDKDTGKCVKSLSDDESCTVLCKDASEQFVSDPKSCYGYYYCADEETPMYGTCPEYTHFNASSQACIWLYESECTVLDFDYCSIVKNSVNFDNVQACDQYHTCTKGKLTTKSCSGSYYQASSGTCVAKPLVNCVAHPLPSKVCGTEKSPYKNKFVADGATCHGYFYCAEQADGTPDSNPSWNHCPEDKFFDSTTQTCRPPNEVKCTEDRCVGRTLNFVLSSTKGCRHYLRCVDGMTLDEKTCGNYFFDEERGACVPNVLTYDIC